MRTRKTLTVIKPDKDAAAIGELYRKARLSLIESVRYAHTCGERLIAKKAPTCWDSRPDAQRPGSCLLRQMGR
jgi:hypothetical protein